MTTRPTKPISLEFAESFDIEGYAEECSALMADVFGMRLDECFVSDESTLADFSGCGIDYDEATQSWDDWLAQKISLRFGVTVSPHARIATVCALIRSAGIEPRLH